MNLIKILKFMEKIRMKNLNIIKNEALIQAEIKKLIIISCYKFE